MKKLMIAFAVAALAVAANAVTCNWSGNSVALSTSKKAASSVTDYAIYLLDNSVVSRSDMMTALGKGDISKLSTEGATVKTTSGIEVGSPVSSIRWAESKWGDFTGGDSYTFYTVIFNNSADKADQYMITATKTSYAPTGIGALSMNFNSQSENSWASGGGGAGGGDIPEPTSGLLLLVGLAGLALKRKQA